MFAAWAFSFSACRFFSSSGLKALALQAALSLSFFMSKSREVSASGTGNLLTLKNSLVTA